MNEREQFLFDLQGFLKVDNFLTTAEVDACNAAFDANWDQRQDDRRVSQLCFLPTYL